MKKYGVLAAMTVLPMSCQVIADNAPPVEEQPVTACGGEIVFMHQLPCDVSPPQVLVQWMDDPGPIQEQECLDSGGTVLFARTAQRHLCWDMDY